jgi:acetate kinase
VLGAWLGSASIFDRESNASAKMLVACYVIPTDEELMIARHTLGVLRAQRNAA